MELSKFTENTDIPLSLISKLCDSRLKELTGASSPPNTPRSHSKESGRCHNRSTSSSLYSGVLHSSGSSSGKKYSNFNHSKYENSTDFGDAKSQQLKITRKVSLSKHIKSVSISEYLRSSEGDTPDIINLGDDVEISILKYRVSNGKWAKLKVVPSLQCLVGSRQLSNVDEIHKWDKEQGFLITSTDEPMVFYGVTDKPSAINPQRLNKLFDNVGVAALPLQSMTTSRKLLYLVDNTARIELNDLSGKLQFEETVSGIPVAVVGKVSGVRLLVEDVIFATPCSPQWPVPKTNNIEMVLISGLYLGSEEVSELCINLLQDYLLGLSGSAFEQTNVLASRSRVFFVGNLISKTPIKSYGKDINHVAAVCTKNIEKLDHFLEPLVQSMEVFLIPGENDITFTSALPQPPFHPKVLLESSRFDTLKRLTNPARIQISVSHSENFPVDTISSNSQHSECSLLDSSVAEFLKEDVQFIDMVLQSGKNVKYTMDYCDISCPIEMARRLLEWAHLHPSSDTSSLLAENTFSIKGSLPHVMVIGNLSEFKCVDWNGTKIIGVPSFQKTHTAVVLTSDFDVIPISFKLK